ncbi:MAG: glycosyltransferase family 4 protein [Actinobacteria bacterium]|nr:glycosyltransferase family 4 protein [Actinomycetota bacterium]
MVAPPWYELPPRGYGGIESVCADLADGLTARGVAVTVIGAGRNGTQAAFVATADEPQYPRLGTPMPDAMHAAALPDILAGLEVDLVHDHSLLGPLTACGRDVPTVVTAHGPVDGELGRYYARLGRRVQLVAISAAQRADAPGLNWVATVHNAVDVRAFPYQADKCDYALFLGRLSPDKGLAEAIAAVGRAGLELVVAAKVSEPAERAYFDAAIRPLLGRGVRWAGEADRTRKRQLLAGARCLLFPVAWAEPFGMVMIEALACGTPVVALRRGSVPEVVRDGVTGWVCDSPAELPAALRRVAELDPAACRADALARFDAGRMCEDYLRVYRRVLRHRPASRGRLVG